MGSAFVFRWIPNWMGCIFSDAAQCVLCAIGKVSYIMALWPLFLLGMRWKILGMLVGYILWRVCLRCSNFFVYLLYLCNIWGCMCSTNTTEFKWSKVHLYLAIFIKSEVLTFPIVVIFLRECEENLIFATIITVQSVVCANIRTHPGRIPSACTLR